MAELGMFTRRPAFVPEDWLRCTNGFVLTQPAPAELRADRYLTSANLWERVLCVMLRAQGGDFGHAALLLDVVTQSDDSHLRDSALTLFSLCAPSDLLTSIESAFRHTDYDTRLAAYAAACLTCNTAVAAALVRHRAHVHRYERARVMDHLSTMLEPDGDDSVLIDSQVDDFTFVNLVEVMVRKLSERYGSQTALFHGEPLDAKLLAHSIASLCEEDEPEQYGGFIAQRFLLLEAMTGVPYAGCLNEDCDPIMPTVSLVLNKLVQSGEMKDLRPGHRYFFGRKLP